MESAIYHENSSSICQLLNIMAIRRIFATPPKEIPGISKIPGDLAYQTATQESVVAMVAAWYDCFYCWGNAPASSPGTAASLRMHRLISFWLVLLFS